MIRPGTRESSREAMEERRRRHIKANIMVFGAITFAALAVLLVA